MSKYKTNSLFKSLTYAYRGIALALKSQRNFRFDFIFGIFVFILAIFLRFSFIELAVLILTMNAVLFAELMNTVIEFIIDAYYGNRYSVIAKMSKDIAAGAVLITAISSLIIGLMLFLPKMIKFYFIFRH